jgi:hypothetical protein
MFIRLLTHLCTSFETSPKFSSPRQKVLQKIKKC